ncbi:MAG: transcriptional regulator PobR [Herminiimonas sp.]|nr:transcriptional regulator PobR [Herminiimonas sp.]MDB5853452.1 transcriptional regulator PobR [Herminiimonas sp.]
METFDRRSRSAGRLGAPTEVAMPPGKKHSATNTTAGRNLASLTPATRNLITTAAATARRLGEAPATGHPAKQLRAAKPGGTSGNTTNATVPAAGLFVPVYHLYGEQKQWAAPELVHCETIAARSRLHNWVIKPHQHHGLFQAMWLSTGTAEVTLDDRMCQMSAGHILTVPEMCIHGFRFSRNADGKVVTLAYPLIRRLGPELADALLDGHGPVMHDLHDAGQRSMVTDTIAALGDAYREPALHRGLMIESLTSVLLVWLARSARHLSQEAAPPARSDQHFTAFCRQVEAHFEERRGVDWHARQIGISAAHLNVLCRKAIGRSAQEIIHARVMLEARRRLVYTSMTIGEVCSALGFSDPAYFTRFFKRETGLSPRDFRERALRQAGQEPAR